MLRYIKKNKLNKGRTITPDAKLKKVLPVGSSAGFHLTRSYASKASLRLFRVGRLTFRMVVCSILLMVQAFRFCGVFV